MRLLGLVVLLRILRWVMAVVVLCHMWVVDRLFALSPCPIEPAPAPPEEADPGP